MSVPIGGFFLCARCGAMNSVPRDLTPAVRTAGIRCVGCPHVFLFAPGTAA